MSRRVVIQKKLSLEDVGALIFLPIYITVGAIIIVPFFVAVEIKAWLARHRIRKEQAASRR